MKALADQIRVFAGDNEQQLSALNQTLTGLRAQAETSAEVAAAAIVDSSAAQEQVARIATLADSVQKLIQEIDGMAVPIDENILHCTAVMRALKTLVTSNKQGAEKLIDAKTRADSILEFGEDFMLFVAQSGIETAETPIMHLCREGADAVMDLFERAVAKGEISMDALFDENFVPIEGTDPQQYMTRYVAFTDRVLPAIQEPMLTRDPRIMFCACVERNSYLPTHNRIYSQPQGDDPVWNAANCRNRRIYNERPQTEAYHSKPLRLQTFRRDMGGGKILFIKIMSIPIFVHGRYWGGFTIGYGA